jgi:hypothetical protein
LKQAIAKLNHKPVAICATSRHWALAPHDPLEALPQELKPQRSAALFRPTSL